MRPFLRGPHAALHATPHGCPAGPAAWLDPGPSQPDLDEILMEASPATREGGPVAVVGLTGVDWVGHSARLCAGPLAAEAPAALLGDALRLLVAYARDELALERLDAVPLTAAACAALADAGFPAPRVGDASSLALPHPLERPPAPPP